MAYQIQTEITNFVVSFLKENKGKDTVKLFSSGEEQKKLQKFLFEILPKSALKLKDPNAPKRPMSSYLLFSKDKREEVKAKFPELKGKEITQKLGEMWKSLSDRKKLKYQNEADKLKAAYKVEMEGYESPSLEELAELDINKKTKKTGKAGKGGKKKKDPSSPKKPRTAYNFFQSEKRAEYKEAGMESKEIQKQLSSDWKSMSKEEKAPFVEKAEEDKKRYKRETEGEEEAEENEEEKEVEAEDEDREANEDRESKEEKQKEKKREKTTPKKQKVSDPLLEDDSDEEEQEKVEKPKKKESPRSPKKQKVVSKPGAKIQKEEESDLEDE